jgi:hypothetical protein
VYGGDVREGREQIEPASLGAELARDEAGGGYRVTHVYSADPDYPDALSPLARPDVDVRDGDIIEAINDVATLSVAHPYAFRGTVVVLVDQRTASDGEAFAEGFRRLGLGKVMGMRTWGGEIWLSSSNFLVDKGIATTAETGVYGPEGEWLIEGHGVQPDIVVDNLPAATFRGGDTQLDAAVRYLQGQIRDHPVPVPPPPAYPDKASKPDRP